MQFLFTRSTIIVHPAPELTTHLTRKVMEADLHNKNLMDLVNKKDESVEQHQVEYSARAGL